MISKEAAINAARKAAAINRNPPKWLYIVLGIVTVLAAQLIRVSMH